MHIDEHHDEHEPGHEHAISKTRRKQQMHDLQHIGERIAVLGDDKLAELDLPERLLDAIRDLRRIHKHGAQRRQMQYIGKLMREVEPAPIVAKLDAWDGVSVQHAAWLHRIEHWRERLLEEHDALTELLTDHPDIDIQHLRALIRNAHREKEQNRPPKSYREIFQILREIMPED